MDGGEVPVTLIVKAPTQHIDDQTVRCNPSWTIERLKNHLAEVYPNKPNPADQRLIYYGHLLTDNETLRDVLTRFDATESVHTLHLVCIPSRESLARSRVSPPRDMARGGVPEGGVAGTPLQAAHTHNPAPPTPEDAYRFFMNPAGYQPWMNEANSGYFQQLAWAQQAYANYYMSQYMDMMARQNGGVYPQGGVPDRNLQRVEEPAPPRVEDDDRNRDWLDYLYIFARLFVLFTIVYFYSSPARFVIVSFLGVVMYLYQVGFFRLQQMQGLENNNEMLNNNVAAENNNLVQGVQGQEARVEAQEAPPVIGEVAPGTPPPEQSGHAPPERPTVFALTWTFLSSFFASLIPENQNAV